MLDLKKTSDLVREDLENDLYLLEILKEDLVNISALARVLLPKIKRKNSKATLESISIAVKRYLDSTKTQKISKAVTEIIARSQLSTKNDVIHITFKRNDYILQRVSEISKKINWDDDEIFFINQGSGEVTIILDKKNEYLLEGCRKYEIESTYDLIIISVKEILEKGKARSIDVPGIYSYFINQLARRSINIISVISTYTQITFALKNKDFIRAYETLQKCINYFRRQKVD